MTKDARFHEDAILNEFRTRFVEAWRRAEWELIAEKAEREHRDACAAPETSDLYESAVL